MEFSKETEPVALWLQKVLLHQLQFFCDASVWKKLPYLAQNTSLHRHCKQPGPLHTC